MTPNISITLNTPHVTIANLLVFLSTQSTICWLMAASLGIVSGRTKKEKR